MVHVQTYCLGLLVVVASCEPFSISTPEDFLNIFYNKLGASHNCSRTHVMLSAIRYTLYTHKNKQNGVVLNSTNLEAVDANNRVIFIVHDAFESGNEKWITEMKDAYLNLRPANIIVVDYSYYAYAKLAVIYCAVPQIGKLTGEFIYNLTVSAHVDPFNIQLNGFSVGAQIAGYAGQEVQILTGGIKIGRINALDAAGPGFLDKPISERLDASDALFVQAIHTSNWQLGYIYPYGTVDFFLNFKILPGCGAIQPGCPLVTGIPVHGAVNVKDVLNNFLCNHIRAAAYFIESINTNNFIGAACGNCIEFGLGKCRFQPTVVMGENCPLTARGEFYLNTNAERTFARGLAGISGLLI